MFEASLGEMYALAAVAGWVMSALMFESAGRRIGSVPVNVIRLLMAVALLSAINLVRGMTPWPSGITAAEFLWLLASGFVGFFLGDLLLFRSYLIIGSRLAMLVMSLSPPLSALLDRIVFGVRLTGWDYTGIALTMAGVALAVTTPHGDEGTAPTTNALATAAPETDTPTTDTPAESVESAALSKPAAARSAAAQSSTAQSAAAPETARWIGFLLAFGGAAGQSGGMILGKLGMASHDALAATFIRTLGGMAGFIPLVLITGALGRVLGGMRDGRAMGRMSIGAVAGPVLGVSAVLMAMRYSPAGVVSAITAIVPVVIILPSVLFLGDRARLREIVGAFIAVAGVMVLILT